MDETKHSEMPGEADYLLRFKLTMWELIQFNFIASFMNPITAGFTLFPAFLNIIFPLENQAGFTGITWWLWRAGVVLFIVIITVLVMAIVVMATVLMNRNANFLAAQTVTVDEEQIVGETELSQTMVNWKAVQKVKVRKAVVYLFISRTAALVIPKRAFTSEIEWAEFTNFCRAHIRKS